jgi:hypothetical protein
MASGDQKIVKIQSHFEALSLAAESLSNASNELSKVVGFVDEVLKNMNLGIVYWLTVSKWSEEHRCGQNQLGYDRIDGKWGLALRIVWGDLPNTQDEVDGVWLFNDAPRDLRLEGVDKLPELIEALSKSALDKAMQVKEKTNKVRELAAAITGNPAATAGFLNITATQVQDIKNRIRETNRFVGSVLEHARSWQHVRGELKVVFPRSKASFVKILQGPSLSAAISDAARQVLNAPARFVVLFEESSVSAKEIK